MSKSKIKEFISTMALWSKTKLWIPIFVTAIFAIPLVNDYLGDSTDFLELSSITLFNLIYITSFWIIYHSFKEYSRLNDFIVANETNDSPLFDDELERAFQTKTKKFRAYILVLMIVLVLFDVFRLIYNLFYSPPTIKLIIFFVLLLISLVVFIACLIKYRKLITFLKSISIEKSKE